MRKRRFCAAVLGAAALAACMAPPKRVESLGLPPAAPDAALVVVPTENTRNAIEFNRKHSRTANMFDPVSKLPKEQPMNAQVSALLYNFKSVVKVDSLNQAKAVDADLIGLVDYYFDYGITMHPFTRSVYRGAMRIDEALLLLDRDGNQVAKIAVSASKDAKALDDFNPFTHFGVDPMMLLFTELQDDVMTKFEAALARSEELKGWRRKGPASAPAVAAASAEKAPRSDVDAPRYKRNEDPAKFALVVGVEDYVSLPAAEFAERDARAVRAHLLALGYPERNVVLLTGREAGKSGLEKYLESWLPRNVGDDARVFVYFAGHGAPDPKTGDAYLMPWDADAKFVDTTAFPVKRLYADLAALKAKSALVAFDAGFSGTGGRSVLARGARPLVTSVDAGLPGSDKLVVLTAASGDEVAGPLKAQGHGLFTYQFLRALNAEGGAASVRALYAELKPKVQDAARRENRDQTPRLLPAAGGDDRTP